jgi:hypothetical protein
MKTDKIQALFQFIDYLYSNIENFKQHDKLINDTIEIILELKNLKPKDKYTDKLKYIELKKEKDKKHSIIRNHVTLPIEQTAHNLKIYDPKYPETVWNWNFAEIVDYKARYQEDDVSQILQYKSKYLQFRKKINAYFINFMFFHDLDEILKELFDYFNDTDVDDFELLKKPISTSNRNVTLNSLYGLKKDNVKEIFEQTENNPKPQIKHEYPTIDKNLYNADLIFSTYVNKAFEGSKECFDAWLVNGMEHPDKLTWILSKREGKPNYAQLRLFINTITNTNTCKDTYYNKVWNAKFKTASIDVATSFDIQLDELDKNCRLKKEK